MFLPNTSILYIKNFIDQDILDDLKSLIDSDYDDFYAKEIVSERLESRSFVFDSKYDDIVNHIYQKACAVLDEHYDTTSKFKWKDRINHFYPGKFFPPHIDNHFEPEVTHGSIFYINDDYEGGEVYYPELGIEIKPAANSFLVHPAIPDHIHGVRAVTAGDRYNITFFAFPEI